MRSHRRLLVYAAILGVAVFAAALVAQVLISLGCSFENNAEAGSPRARFCDSLWVGYYAMAAPVAVALLAGGISVWLLRVEPLVLGAMLAVLMVLTPFALRDGLSGEAPSASVDRVEPSIPDTLPSAPGAGRLPVDQQAGAQAQSDAEQAAGEVGLCLRTGGAPADCEARSFWARDLVTDAEIEVDVLGQTRWRVSARTRTVVPTHSSSALYDERRNRVVHTCVPPRTGICTTGRRVARMRPLP